MHTLFREARGIGVAVLKILFECLRSRVEHATLEIMSAMLVYKLEREGRLTTSILDSQCSEGEKSPPEFTPSELHPNKQFDSFFQAEFRWFSTKPPVLQLFVGEFIRLRIWYFVHPASSCLFHEDNTIRNTD